MNEHPLSLLDLPRIRVHSLNQGDHYVVVTAATATDRQFQVWAECRMEMPLEPERCWTASDRVAFCAALGQSLFLLPAFVAAVAHPGLFTRYDELGAPLAWTDDPSGALQLAVLAFVGNGAGFCRAHCTPEELALLKAYLCYVIHAPCWSITGDDAARTVQRLRNQVLALSQWEIAPWLKGCETVGIDPLPMIGGVR